jgi:hypothetical protein
MCYQLRKTSALPLAAALESAQIALQEARRTLGQVERHLEAIPEQRYHEIRVAAPKADRDERAGNNCPQRMV